MDQSLRGQSTFASNTAAAYVPAGAYPCSDNVLQTTFRSTSSSMTGYRTRESEARPYTPRQYAPDATFRASQQLMTTRTSSFLTVDREVADNLFVTEQQYYAMTMEETSARRRVSRPGYPANGEQDAPVGDALFPLLFCAGLYSLYMTSKRLLTKRKRKTILTN